MANTWMPGSAFAAQGAVETFPDDGDIDMLKVMQTLKEAGYTGMVCPDHDPVKPGGPDQTNALQYGYIRGLLRRPVPRPTHDWAQGPSNGRIRI